VQFNRRTQGSEYKPWRAVVKRTDAIAYDLECLECLIEASIIHELRAQLIARRVIGQLDWSAHGHATDRQTNAQINVKKK
jgi:hypothetical protein